MSDFVNDKRVKTRKEDKTHYYVTYPKNFNKASRDIYMVIKGRKGKKQFVYNKGRSLTNNNIGTTCKHCNSCHRSIFYRENMYTCQFKETEFGPDHEVCKYFN